MPKQAAGPSNPKPSNGGATTRPESILITRFGIYALGRHVAVSAGGVIDVLGRLGITEHATRATLNRMSRRGLLHSVRQGRLSYLALTRYAEDVLADGEQRINSEVVNRDWDGHWTVLGFSVPETRRADRHALRSHLGWAGFGLLQNGLWIAPSPADVNDALEKLDLLDHVKMFRAQAISPTRPEDLVREAWDLDQLADGYARFLARWERGTFDGPDDLGRQVMLHTEWLLLIREDPRLPLVLLPEDWPGVRAEELFWKLRDELAESARGIAASTLDTIPVPEPATPHS